MDFKEMLISRLDPLVDHERDQCGLCCKQYIMEDVANEILDQELNITDLKGFYDEVDKRWIQSPIYKQVVDLMSRGLPLEDVEEMLEKQGIFI